MRIQILSDLHLEFEGNVIPALAPEAELVILAGDLAPVRTRRIGDIAKRWDWLLGPPTILFFSPDRAERRRYRLVGFEDADEFSPRLTGAFGAP